MVLVDNSGSGSESAPLDSRDTVKIIITMSCDPHTAARLEESVKQSILESTQVGGGGASTCTTLWPCYCVEALREMWTPELLRCCGVYVEASVPVWHSCFRLCIIIKCYGCSSWIALCMQLILIN